MLTLLEAARETGRTKPAILKAIKRGSISATKNDAGEWQIDAAELFRVYPQVNARGETADRPLSNTETLVELAVAQERLARIEAERDRERRQLEETIADLRADRDHWRQQATALLTDQGGRGPRGGEHEARAPTGGYWRSLWAALGGRRG